MRVDRNRGNEVIYEHNSFGGPVVDPTYKEPPLKISGDADRYDQPIVDDDYVQPGNLFRLMSPDEQARLIENIVGALKNVPEFIQKRMVAHFIKADPAYGDGVAKGLGL